jgi:hypothetical protein
MVHRILMDTTLFLKVLCIAIARPEGPKLTSRPSSPRLFARLHSRSYCMQRQQDDDLYNDYSKI